MTASRTSTHVTGRVARADPLPQTSAHKPTLAELFHEHLAFVWRVLAARGVLDADVKDVAQEVFMTAHRRMDDWNPERASARTWLYAICVRLASNHRRGVRRAIARVHPEPANSEQPDPEGALEQARALAKLDAAIEALDPSRRDVFVLFELEDLSMKEVADAVGCPLATAYTRLYAARREIALALEEEGSP